MDRELVLELPSDVRTIEHAVSYVMARCAVCEIAARKLDLNLRVGLTEALSNAMLYGNAEDPAKRVRVEISLEAGSITARITDQGDGFDPGAVPDPRTPRNLVGESGRGLFLMRELLDEVHYNERGNSVTLVLRVEASVVQELSEPPDAGGCPGATA
jgi:serine/threonine-protein kinase RsbW